MQKEGYVIKDQKLPHFVTATVVDWIDVFTRDIYFATLIESLDPALRSLQKLKAPRSTKSSKN